MLCPFSLEVPAMTPLLVDRALIRSWSAGLHQCQSQQCFSPSQSWPMGNAVSLACNWFWQMRPGRWRIGELLGAFHTLSKGHKTGLHFPQFCLCCLGASLRNTVVILGPWGEWPKGSHALTTDTEVSDSHACGQKSLCPSSAHNSPLPVKTHPLAIFPLRRAHFNVWPATGEQTWGGSMQVLEVRLGPCDWGSQHPRCLERGLSVRQGEAWTWGFHRLLMLLWMKGTTRQRPP